MNRRELMFAVITAAASAGIAVRAVASDADSAAVFLHDVYEREIARHNKRLPPDNDAFYALFTREMRELMHAPRLPNPRDPIGPILHALFGRGVLPGTRSHPRRRDDDPRSDDGIAMLDVALTVRGNRRNSSLSRCCGRTAPGASSESTTATADTLARSATSARAARPAALTTCEK